MATGILGCYILTSDLDSEKDPKCTIQLEKRGMSGRINLLHLFIKNKCKDSLSVLHMAHWDRSAPWTALSFKKCVCMSEQVRLWVGLLFGWVCVCLSWIGKKR